MAIDVEALAQHRCELRFHHVEQLALRIARPIADGALHRQRRRRAAIDLLARVQAVAAVPVVPRRETLRLGQQGEEVELALHAQEVHVEPRVELVSDVAVDVVVGDQQVVDALEQRVADDPRRLRRLAHHALDDAGAVEVPEDGERGVVVAALAVPDQAQVQTVRALQRLCERIRLGLQVLVLRASRTAAGESGPACCCCRSAGASG